MRVQCVDGTVPGQRGEDGELAFTGGEERVADGGLGELGCDKCCARCIPVLISAEFRNEMKDNGRTLMAEMGRCMPRPCFSI